MKPIHFAIIGAGAIARAYETVLAEFEGATLSAVCDVSPSALAGFAKPGRATFGSLNELTLSRAADAVIVCTPPATHETIATHFLFRGVPVLCEKPLSTSVASARRTVLAARATGTLFTMASKFRYVDDVRRAKHLVDSGAIGDIVMIDTSFTSKVDMSRRWNSDPAVSGGGVLIDNGTHAVDVLRYFLGELVEVHAVEAQRSQNLAVEDTVRLFVRNERGAIGSSDLSWSIDKGLSTFLRIYGSNGTILVGWKSSQYRIGNETEWSTLGSGYDKIAAFRAQLQNFCDAIRGVDELHITPLDALASVDVVATAYDDLQEARWRTIRIAIPQLDLEVV